MTIDWNSRRTTLALWGLWCVFYLAAMLTLVGAGRAYPGDELRFIETSRLFAGSLTLDLLQHYPEMSGPLPFALFAQWGKWLGWDLGTMRTFAVLIAFAALLLLHVWLREELGEPRPAFALGLLLCLNPYVAAMSVFLYTDMISILFVLAALVASQTKNAVWMGIWLSAAVLSRQYLVFVALALAIHYYGRSARMLIASGLALLPAALLIALWGGMAPANALRDSYLTNGTTFHISSLVGYIGLLFLYLAPLVLWRWRAFLPSRPTLAVVFLLSLLYVLFPIRPSPGALQAGITTVGLLDRVLLRTVSSQLARDTFYWAAFACGLIVGATLYPRLRERKLDMLLIAAFLLVMPFSYLYWEKYLLPVLPAAALAIARHEAAANQTQTTA